MIDCCYSHNVDVLFQGTPRKVVFPSRYAVDNDPIVYVTCGPKNTAVVTSE